MASNRDSEFSSFGNTKPTRRKSRFRRFLFWLILFCVAASVPFAFSGWRDIYVNFLEKEPPTIETPNLPAGLGTDGMELRIAVTDLDSGLDEVVVRAEQNNETKELLRKRYTDKQSSDTLIISLPGKESGYEEGTFRVNVSAFDRSFWTNAKSLALEFKVDYTKPKIEVLTTQHNAVQGGAEFVFYRLIENDPNVFSGVKAGEWLFPGFPAKNLDPEFQSQPNVYFSFFPIPLNFNSETDKVRIFARDAVGNVGTSSMYYHIANVKVPVKELKLSESFIREKVEDLLPKFYALQAKVDRRKDTTTISKAQTTEELIERFRIVNGDFRALIERLLQSLFARPKASKLWDGPFMRQPGAAQQAGFGEKRKYTFEGSDVGESMHTGVDLASTANTPVRAANNGIVIYADDLGIYGNTLIIDHGFGLATLYGHLSSIQVSEGDSVTGGQEVARSGNTGFAEGDHLHFEIRLHGVPVRPIEWWDAKWLRDHVELKIEETKKALGLQTAKPL